MASVVFDAATRHPRAAAATPAAAGPSPTSSSLAWLKVLPPPIRPFVAVVQLVLEVPVMGGAENLLGLLIIGIAMWQAWKVTASRVPRITGPYRAGSTPAARVLPPALPGDVL